MKTLYLLRHARTAFDGSWSDFERPLTPTGTTEARKISDILLKEQLRLPFVLSSPAIRARETAEILVTACGWPLNFESRIYDAELRTLLEVIGEINDEHEVAILIGHNPGVESLLRYFTGEVRSVTTGGLAKLIIETESWRESDRTKARLAWVTTP
jgi:phosphohistidine phosphatase